MKPKLTKAQLAKAKRLLLLDMGLTRRAGIVGTMASGWLHRRHPEWPEVERLWQVALRAVRGA